MHKQKGFTLIELLIIIVTISLLAAVILPNWIAYKEKAKMKEFQIIVEREKVYFDDVKVKKLMPDGTWAEFVLNDSYDLDTDWTIENKEEDCCD